jgi:hypothetical protein
MSWTTTPRLLNSREQARTQSASFISWERLARLLENVGECSSAEYIEGFTLDQSGGLTIHRNYHERPDDD